jgi:hypothetical protein
MKFVISNYGSTTQTECFYFNAALNLINGCSSAMWDNKTISAYDMFDAIKPDYFITHINTIFTDVLHYIEENGGPSLIINATGLKADNIKEIESVLLSKKIPISFFYSNSDDQVYKLSKTNMICIPLGADVFLNTSGADFNINKCFLINKEDQLKSSDGTYHNVSTGEADKNIGDIHLGVSELAQIYKNYDEIVFRFYGSMLPQSLFDAIYYGNKVYYDLEDGETQGVVESKLKKIFKVDDLTNVKEIKNIVKNKHTCLHRTKSLLSQLPSHNIINGLDQIIDYQKGLTT